MTTDTRTGLAAALLAFSMWGVFPLYFAMLRHVPAGEILIHRIIWAVPVLAVIVTLRRRWADVRAAVSDRKALLTLSLSAAIIALNWFIYTYAVTSDQVLSASLGYYINPLITVALGVFLLHEPLSRAQHIAIGLAALGVLNQIVVVGEFPLIALGVAFTFAAYGFIRKQSATGPMSGLFIETALVAPFCFAGFFWLQMTGESNLFIDAPTFWLLAATGAVSATPLFLFVVGAQRLRLSTIGLLQYIAPTLVLICGIALGEPFTPSLAVTFALIWIGLAVFSADAWRQDRRALQLAKRKPPV